MSNTIIINGDPTTLIATELEARTVHAVPRAELAYSATIHGYANADKLGDVQALLDALQESIGKFGVGDTVRLIQRALELHEAIGERIIPLGSDGTIIITLGPDGTITVTGPSVELKAAK